MLLALDTATRHSGIALLDGQQLVAELTWHSTDAQTVELMPRLAQLLSWHGLAPAALTAIAVSLGPGSYTGLRVAVSVAKGLALAHSLPLIGIPTLDATAFPHLGRPEPVCAVVQAGRGRILWSTYWPAIAIGTDRLSDGIEAAWVGGWEGVRSAYALSEVNEMAAAVREPTYFVGELPAALREQLQAILGQQARLASFTSAPRRAGALAELAWRRLQAGDSDDLAALSPIYLREP